MIFSCGETKEHVIARQEAEFIAWCEKHRQWLPYFVWWPTVVEVVDGRKVCAWLETIERRGCLKPYRARGIDGYLFESTAWFWEYRRSSAAEDSGK